jgi:hypothetical protein
MCATTLLGQLLTRADYERGVTLKSEFGKLTFPYVGGISYDEYYGQRAMVFHFDYASCSSASATSWQSTGCQFNQNQTGNKLYNFGSPECAPGRAPLAAAR